MRGDLTNYNFLYYPYASFTNAQLPQLKVTTLYFDKLVIIDPVGTSWATIDADYPARQAIKQLKGAGILQTVMPADVLAKCAAPDAIYQDMYNKEFLDLCEALGGGR